MSKVAFTNNEGSVLREWEQMHRPPENIPTSGPHAHSFTTKMPRSGLIVPPPPKGGSGRRHSVISSSKEITSFPLKPGAGGSSLKNGSSGGSGDLRRPSEVWLGKPPSTIRLSIYDFHKKWWIYKDVIESESNDNDFYHQQFLWLFMLIGVMLFIGWKNRAILDYLVKYLLLLLLPSFHQPSSYSSCTYILLVALYITLQSFYHPTISPPLFPDCKSSVGGTYLILELHRPVIA